MSVSASVLSVSVCGPVQVGRHYRAVASALESQLGIKVSLDLQHCDKWHDKEVSLPH